jgi:hypothetical protein
MIYFGIYSIYKTSYGGYSWSDLSEDWEVKAYCPIRYGYSRFGLIPVWITDGVWCSVDYSVGWSNLASGLRCGTSL